MFLNLLYFEDLKLSQEHEVVVNVIAAPVSIISKSRLPLSVILSKLMFILSKF
jgi:hypothetical protein